MHDEKVLIIMRFAYSTTAGKLHYSLPIFKSVRVGYTLEISYKLLSKVYIQYMYS